VNDNLGDCSRRGGKPFLWHCLLRLRRGLRRSRLHFGQRLFTAFCADGARCVFRLFRAFPFYRLHALRAASAVAALTTLAAFSTFTAPAASAPAPAASGFTAAFRALFILWSGFCAGLCFALGLRPWCTRLARFAWFARWALAALGA